MYWFHLFGLPEKPNNWSDLAGDEGGWGGGVGGVGQGGGQGGEMGGGRQRAVWERTGSTP